jgi:hypothetical protein
MLTVSARQCAIGSINKLLMMLDCLLLGLGIINPPDTAENDVIRYPDDKTIVYEVKAGGAKAGTIHHLFFARMSTGSITFPIRLNEAVDLYSKNESFNRFSSKKEKILNIYRTMDLAEKNLKILILLILVIK